MQDNNREQDRERSSDINQDFSPKEAERIYDDQASEKNEEGIAANVQKPVDDGAPVDEKEKANASEGNDNREEGIRGEETLSDQGSSASLNHDPTKEDGTPYSSVSYTPPYYVPNFTVYHPAEAEVRDESNAKKRGGAPIWGIVLSVALSLLISFGIGTFAGIYGARMAMSPTDETAHSGVATIEKNTASIEIQEVLSSETDVYTEVSSVAKVASDCVVEITTSKTQTHSFYGQYVTSGAGSGVIVAQNPTTGIIVTNYHVIEGADNVVVRLTNGNEYKATYRGGDESMDIAVLYIALEEGEALSCATLGDSSSLVVGQRVVAIGNPLGRLGGTVTDGIISALDRKIRIDDNVMTLLQTNTAINPGNSGGGLFDMAGRLVGIVNAKQSAEGIEGLGFAIPVNIIEDAIASITEHGYVQNRPTLGIDVSYMDSSFWGQGGYYSAGLYVASVSDENSPLRAYDRIVSIQGETVDSKIAYNAMLNGFEIGDEIEVVIYRNKQQYTVKLTVRENTLPY